MNTIILIFAKKDTTLRLMNILQWYTFKYTRRTISRITDFKQSCTDIQPGSFLISFIHDDKFYFNINHRIYKHMNHIPKSWDNLSLYTRIGWHNLYNIIPVNSFFIISKIKPLSLFQHMVLKEIKRATGVRLYLD